MSGPGRCPICGAALYGWLSLPARDARATVGMPSPVDPDSTASAQMRLIDRCDGCEAGIVRDSAPFDHARELEAITVRRREDGYELRAPNRASLQAGIGGEGWAALAEWRGRVLYTPRSLSLLVERQGMSIEGPGFAPWGRSQVWMWQTLVNGLTLHPNFALDARAGRLRPGEGRGRAAYAIDAMVSLLAAPFVALVAVPMELVAGLARRGGELVAVARR